VGVVRLLAFFLLLLIPGCAWFGTKSTPAEEVNAAPKVAHKYEVPKPSKREPGALWSEDSRWNNIYSSANARLVGDVINLKVNEPLKDRISMAMNQNRRVENPKNTGEAKADAKNDPKGESREPASVNSATAKKDDTPAVEATILEVLPNGAYRVGVNRAFKVGREQPYVVMEGVIREKEIGSDDSASSDALMNLKLETFDEQKHAFNADKKNGPESNEKK
jgi:flagellar basal body L-ring protein FlgH